MANGAFDEVLTARLRLVRPTDDDFIDLFAMHNHPRVSPTLGGPTALADGQARHRSNLEHWEKYGYGYWVARDRTTGAFLGRGGLRHIRLEDADEVEVGYGFLPEAWGRGLATELASQAAAVAAKLNLTGVVAIALPNNRASRRVMEKVGMQYERECLWAGVPHVLYRLK